MDMQFESGYVGLPEHAGESSVLNSFIQVNPSDFRTFVNVCAIAEEDLKMALPNALLFTERSAMPISWIFSTDPYSVLSRASHIPVSTGYSLSLESGYIVDRDEKDSMKHLNNIFDTFQKKERVAYIDTVLKGSNFARWFPILEKIADDRGISLDYYLFQQKILGKKSIYSNGSWRRVKMKRDEEYMNITTTHSHIHTYPVSLPFENRDQLLDKILVQDSNRSNEPLIVHNSFSRYLVQTGVDVLKGRIAPDMVDVHLLDSSSSKLRDSLFEWYKKLCDTET